jgi:hypothetical protein
MDTYIGTKVVKARPMNRGDYNIYRGWTLPSDENGKDDGYLVEYRDGGKPNDSRHAGYISWSPKDVFESAYKVITGMTFGQAIEAAKAGSKIARSGWNGKNMFVVYMPAMDLAAYNDQTQQRRVNDRTAKFVGADKALHILPYFAMYTATGEWLPGWLASQTDMLAEDWTIVP